MTSTAETGSSQQTVRVAVAVPLDRTFDYNHSGLGALPRGTIVSVPFGPRQLNGIVLGPGDGAIAATTLKPVTGVAPLPPLAPAFVDFLERVASWTMAPIGGVVKMALSQPQALQPPPQRKVYRRPDPPPVDESLTAARRRVAEVLEVAGALSAADLQREAGVSAGVGAAGSMSSGAETRRGPGGRRRG